MAEFIAFFKNEFFPGLLNFINTILESSFDISLSYNQLAVITGLLIVLAISLLLDLIKKAIPLLVLLIIILYFVYGDLSFIDNIVNSFKYQS